MDPLSLTASITAVVTLAAQVSSICYEYIIAVANASKDAQSLWSELTIVSYLLSNLNTIIPSIPKGQSIWFAVVKATKDDYETALKELQQRLEAARPPQKSSLNRLKKKLVWPFEKDDFDQVMGRLERQKTSLTNLLAQGNLYDILNF
jgi:hypothetical protein